MTTKTELADDFISAIAETRRLFATRKEQDPFWEQGGRIDAKAAALIGEQAKIDAMHRTCGYAEKHLRAMAAAGLPESLRLRCARALRPCDVGDADWAKTGELLEAWAAGEQAAAPGPVDDRLGPFTPREKTVIKALLSCPETEGLTGKEIMQFADHHYHDCMEIAALTQSKSGIFAKLRAKGIPIGNNRGAGYFIADSAIRAKLLKIYPPEQPVTAKR